jgi:hypothetical protein
MHTVPLDIIAACVGTLAALQGLSLLLTHLQTAARKIEGRSTWIARDGTVFDEFEVTELESSEVMKHEFEEIRSEVAMAVHLSTANG